MIFVSQTGKQNYGNFFFIFNANICLYLKPLFTSQQHLQFLQGILTRDSSKLFTKLYQPKAAILCYRDFKLLIHNPSAWTYNYQIVNGPAYCSCVLLQDGGCLAGNRGGVIRVVRGENPMKL